MRKVSIILISIFITVASLAQQYTIEFNNKIINTPPKTSINGSNRVLFNFTYPGVNIIEINTNKGVYNQLIVPNTYRSGSVGNPQLVSSHKLIEIPHNCNVSIRVIDFTVNEYSIDNYFADNKIIPYQPSYSKNKNIEDIEFVVNTKAYSKNEYDTNEIASIKILGSLRGRRIAKISINPLDYNPTQNSIRVYNDINVEIVYSYTQSKLTPLPSKCLSSPYFSQVFSKIESVLPATKYDDHPDLVTHPVKYLVVTPNSYLTQLKEFIKWKKQKGFQVVVGNLDSIGSTATEIKTWVHNQYNNATVEDPAPSFLLLVGDVQQIPASQTGVNTNRATDLYYASVDGDMFPDMYYGRLSAQNTTQLTGMLDKILLYEKYQFTDDTFLNDVTLIAGADGSMNTRIGQPTVNYGTSFYFNSTNGFNNVNAYLSTYSGCYDEEKIGVSMINYTAHCSQTSWATPSLSASTVNAFENSGKYPVAIGNCCTSGDFSISECIGEAWIRSPNGGAIAYLGSVPDTYWWEDFYWAVGAHNPVDYNYPDSSSSSLGVYDAPFKSDYKTVDAMVFVGNLAVTEARNEGFYSEINSLYYWEAYHCLGDPSLVPYLTQGTDNTVTHESMFPYKTNIFQVKASPGSLVALSNGNGLIGISTSDNDSIALIQTDTLTIIDSIQIVVTKPQYKPYMTKIPMGQVQGTYLIVENTTINDVLSNDNNRLDFNEEANIELSIKNIGTQTANNIFVSINSSNYYIEYLNDNQEIFIDNLPADNSISITDHFNIKIKDSIPDGYQIPFTVELSDSLPLNERNYHNSSFAKIVDAPLFKVLQYQILDDFTGNGNGVIDYGETVILQLAIINEGHSQVSSTVLLSNISVDGSTIINTNQINLDEFALNDTMLVNFEIYLPNNAFVKSTDTLLLRVERGEYFAASEILVNLGQTLFAEIGTGVFKSKNYPLNNYFQNNTTQILYLKSEIGLDAKVLNSIAFDISEITSNIIYRDLNNFIIEAVFTNLNELNSAVDFTNSQVLYTNPLYILPESIGWEKFELQQPIIISDNRNLVIQISWGTNDNWAPIDSTTSVYCSSTSFKSVVWGADDDIYPAPLGSISNNRPNTQFEFDSVGVINISVQSNLPINNIQWVENCSVTIDSGTQLTNEQGRTQFYYEEYSGEYTIGFNAYGHTDTTIVLQKNQIYSHLDITLHRVPKFTLIIKDSIGMFIANAKVEIGEDVYYSNSQGAIISYSTDINTYAVYTISKTNYFTITDSIYINTADNIDIAILLIDYADVTIQIQNSFNEPIADVEVIIGELTQLSNEDGLVTFTDMVNGNYLVQLYHTNYKYKTDNIELSEHDSTFNYTLKTIGSVIVNISDGLNTLSDIDIIFNNKVQTTNNSGETIFNSIEEGKYLITVNDTNFQAYSDSVTIFGTTTTLAVELKNKADIEFYIHNGFIGINGAKIEFDTITKYCDALGYSQIINADTANYKYTISADGYYPISDFVKIEFKDTILNIKLNIIPDLTLQLISSEVALNNIPIVINNNTLFSDEFGTVKIPDIGSGTFEYTINGIGFYDIINSVTITNNDTIEEIYLQPIPDVKFIITDNKSSIEGVKVRIDNNTLFTDSLGEVVFTDLPKGDYSYSLEKNEYLTKNGTFYVNDNDITLSLKLVLIDYLFSVKFVIVDNDGPVYGANIAFDSKTKSTNSVGEAIFTNTSPNSYLQYQVWKKETYNIDTGFIDLVSDTTINITLIKVGVEDNEYTIKIYPNPTQGTLFIEADSDITGSEYQIINSDGKMVSEGKIDDIPQEINLNNKHQGLYHIKIITIHNEVITRSIILE